MGAVQSAGRGMQGWRHQQSVTRATRCHQLCLNPRNAASLSGKNSKRALRPLPGAIGVLRTPKHVRKAGSVG